MLFTWQIFVMSLYWSEPMVRYWMLFGLFAVLQFMLDRVLSVPAPRWHRETTKASQGKRFSIRSLLVLTTVIAILMAAFREYAPQIESLETVLLALPLLLTLRILAASAFLARQHHAWRAIILLVVLGIGSLLYSWIIFSLSSVSSNDLTITQFLGELTDQSGAKFIWLMQVISIGMFVSVSCLSFLLGRIDRHDAAIRNMRATV